MKMMYATTIRYPSLLANRKQILAMSRAFIGELGDQFVLAGIRLDFSDSAESILPQNTFELGEASLPVLAWRVVQAVKKQGITDVYCREKRLLTLVHALCCVFLPGKVNFFYEIHAFPVAWTLDAAYERYLSLFRLRRVFVTAHLQARYEKVYHIAKGTSGKVLPDAVDLKVFGKNLLMSDCRARIGIAESDWVIGYVGRLKTLGMDKGVGLLLRALQQWGKKKPVRLLVVGGSPEEITEYSAMATSLGVKDVVDFVPSVAQSELPTYLQACDMLAMPFPESEHFNYYMSPLKLFEYMASRRPIIATNLPSIREILTTETNAILVPPEDESAFLRAMECLMNDQGFAEQIAERAYQDVQAYTWEKRVHAIIHDEKAF